MSLGSEVRETQIVSQLDPASAKAAGAEPPWSAQRTLTLGQRVVFLAVALLLVAAGLLAPLALARVLLTATTVLFLCSILLRSTYSIVGLRAAQGRPAPLEEKDLPSYTVIVALYREAAVAPQLCGALASLDYPADRLQVILACEEADTETIEACRSNSGEGWLVLVVPPGSPQTKPRALNAALAVATGDLITIYDAEDIPDPGQLRLAAAGFAAGGDRLGSLQARLDVHNESESLVARCFAVDYVTLFSAVLPGIASLGQPMPLGGTSTHFRTPVVRQLGGWDPWNVTEDCELGIRLAANGYESGVIESTTMEEAVVGIRAWINQRSRWVKGYAQTALVMLRRPTGLVRDMGPVKAATGLLTVAGVPLVLLLQPLAVVLVVVYLVDVVRNGSSRLLTPVFPEPIASVALVAFVSGFFLLIFCHLLAVHRDGRSGLVACSLLLPAYLLMGSVAAWKGCLQLVTRPHFWDKTSHGVSTSVQPGLAGGSSLDPGDSGALGGGDAGSAAANAVGGPASSATERGETDDRSPADWWLRGLTATSVGVLVVAAVLSRKAFLDYSDAPAHLNTAHRLLDNASPGLDQLGLHWLPLFHLLEAPFASVDYLYRTGWAGAIASIIAGTVAIGYLYRVARACGASPPEAAAVGVAVLAQPAFLYVSVVPMHYSLLIATAAASTFYLMRWCQRGDSLSLVLSAVAAGLATLTHFDAWVLLPIELVIVASVAFRRRARTGLADDSVVWLVFAASGVALFLFLNIWWKGDPVAFLSAVSDGGDIVAQAHHGWSALVDHPRAVWVLAGPPTTLLGLVGAALFAWRWRRDPARLVALLLFYPVAFFLLQAATVGSLIEPAATVADWRNLRYAATMVPALAAFGVMGWTNWKGVAFVAAAALVAVGVTQLASGRNAAMTEAAGDIPRQTTESLDRAGAWLRANAGDQRVMLLRASLQERFELVSGLPGSQFIDDNDSAFQFVRTGRQSPDSVGIGWLVRLRRLDPGVLPTPIPPAIRAKLSDSPCAVFGPVGSGGERSQAPWVSIWRVGAQC